MKNLKIKNLDEKGIKNIEKNKSLRTFTNKLDRKNENSL